MRFWIPDEKVSKRALQKVSERVGTQKLHTYEQYCRPVSTFETLHGQSRARRNFLYAALRDLKKKLLFKDAVNCNTAQSRWHINEINVLSIDVITDGGESKYSEMNLSQ